MLLRGGVGVAALSLAVGGSGQTLARPGWKGSGMTVERWWPHAVLCEMRPDSLAEAGAASALGRLSARLEDLQTLGVDGVLLRGIEAEAPAGAGEGKSAAGGVAPIDARYGSLEEFDALVGSAVRRGMRVLVELRPDAHGAALTNDARFWLNHGVTGLSVSSSDAGEIRAIRAVLRGYVGERVLISEAGPGGASGDRAARGDDADMVRVALPAVAQGASALRSAMERAQAVMKGRGAVPLLSGEGAGTGPERVMATALLGSGGAVLLRVDDLDLAQAAAAGAQATVFGWYRQWSGLHRGNAVMRTGPEVLLDHDAEGALVWVREPRGGAAAPIVAICNVTDKPVRLSLTEDIARLRLRGSFLRTVARSDGGMGAMPLRSVVLPAYGVYVGELSR